MKSIDKKDFIAAGVIEKAHGTKGELRLGLDTNLPLKEWVFIEINKKPVPFFIEHASQNEFQTIVKLEGIDDLQRASGLTGHQVLLLSKKGSKKRMSIDKTVEGFTLTDSFFGSLGKVEKVEESPGQVLFSTTYQDRELLIPAVEEFILKIDQKKKTIYLNLPEGLLDL